MIIKNSPQPIEQACGKYSTSAVCNECVTRDTAWVGTQRKEEVQKMFFCLAAIYMAKSKYQLKSLFLLTSKMLENRRRSAF